MIIVDEAQFRTLPASIATARAYQSLGARRYALAPSHMAAGRSTSCQRATINGAGQPLRSSRWHSGRAATWEEAYQTLADAMANFQKIGNLHFAISGTYGLGDIRTAQGRLHEAIKIYTQVLQLALEHGEPLIRGTADLYLGLSELYHEQGDLAAADAADLLSSEELGEQAGLPDLRYRMCRAQARFKQTQGDLAGALDLLDEAERHYRRTPVPRPAAPRGNEDAGVGGAGPVDEALRLGA